MDNQDRFGFPQDVAEMIGKVGAEEATEALSPEEEAQRERQRAAQQQREVNRRCEEDYLAVVTSVSALFDELRQSHKTTEEKVEAILQRIRAMYEAYPPAVLLEKMQLVRYDERYYQYHAVNVALLSALVGGMMGLYTPDIERLIQIGLVMDFGMLRLPMQIIDRSSALNDGQRVRVRQHQIATVRILEASGIEDSKVVQAVINHHERYNGRGYPRGIAGEEIPLLARVVAFADSFDAAMARKEYQKAKTLFQVMWEFSLNPDGMFDPGIAQLATNGIAQMLVGSFVVLSDRSIGKILEFEPDNLAFPVVNVVGRVIKTSPQLYAVSLSSYMPLT